MKKIKKSAKLDHVLYDVRGPVVEEAARMEESGIKILKLNIGNPAPFGFTAPDEVIFDMRNAVPDSQGYSDSRGIFSARKAIMQYAQIKKIPYVTIKDIYTGNGASELIQMSMNALLNDGDEILIPAPDYPLWTPYEYASDKVFWEYEQFPPPAPYTAESNHNPARRYMLRQNRRYGSSDF